MPPTGDVVSSARRTRGLGHTLSCAARVVAAALVLSQASCMLVGYENQQSSPQGRSDAGAILMVPDDGSDTPTRDGAVSEPVDGGITSAELDAAAGASTSVADMTDSGPMMVPPPPMPDPGGMPTPPTPPAPPAVDTGGPMMINPPVPGCMGAPALGLCWHLGAYGVSCDEACDTSYGGFDPRTIFYTGKPSEGGSLVNCHTVLVALGISTAPMASYRPDGLGLGCHVLNGATYWLDQRQGPFDSGDSLYSVRRACACAH
jgi:hypothetical protein